MSRAYICDRCKRYFTAPRPVMFLLPVFPTDQKPHPTPSQKLDLCGDCAPQFHAYIANLRVEPTVPK